MVLRLAAACLLAAGHAHAAPFPAKNTTHREDYWYERLVVVGGGINSVWCASPHRSPPLIPLLLLLLIRATRVS